MASLSELTFAADPGVGVPDDATARAGVLLVVEDTAWVRRVLPVLSPEGFRCTVDPCGNAAYSEAELVGIDVAVVDLGATALPGRAGLAVCEALRSRSDVPLLAVGRSRDEEAVLAAFAAGADQFVAVEASPRLLLARVRSLLRRYRRRVDLPVDPAAVGPVALHDELCAAVVNGATVALLKPEYEVLRTLLARGGRVVARQELLLTTLPGAEERGIDFVIRRLRQKLEAYDTHRRITAVRGVGFRFEAEDARCPVLRAE